MATNLRVGLTHGYQPYREVEPVPAYPRVDPQQPRDEYPRQQTSQRADKDEHARRRFRAMRQLIDKLKESETLVRVDFFTAETELHDLGLAIAEQELIEQLLELKILLEPINDLFQQIRQQAAAPELESGLIHSQAASFLPVFVAGLSEYNLNFKQLRISSGNNNHEIFDAVNKEGRFVSEKKRLRLDFRAFPADDNTQMLLLNICVLVAVSEMDEDGRKVLLYQRPNQTYALYADKQINLSI
ncbi:MAG: hypothetical protein OQK50_02170 [Deltaproteobacteria bacterium]|jgi:hypothetical protein|nr:hypothetical protein [Deltaproteobacteria bacterium]MCW9049122.1 hypothetical protein [Deltaproteobacteria bacterium]